jgi:DNA-directed RNA polymerase beta' subunit
MTRHLTEKEIDHILNFIQPNKHIPLDSAISIVEINKEKLRIQLREQKVYAEIIPILKKQMKKDYENSLIHAGESVGVVCAQSIGERQTQMSVAYNERVVLKIEDDVTNMTIGDFIDTVIEDMANEKSMIKNGESSVLPVKNIKILSIGKRQELNWCDITEISRHPPNGKLMSVITESGRCVTTTLSHSHLCLDENENVCPILGSELKINHKIPIVSCYMQPTSSVLTNITFDDRDMILTEDLGFLMGKYLSTGVFVNDSVNIETIHHERIHNMVKSQFSGKILRLKHVENGQSKCSVIVPPFSFLSKFLGQLCGDSKKIIPDFVFQSNVNFLSEFLIGFLSETQENVFTSDSNDIMEGIALLLSYFGIYGKFGYIEHSCYNVNDINNLINKKLCSPKVIWESIVSIQYFSRYHHKYVYDFSVAENETFALQSGILVHNTLNTFHKAGQSEKTVTMGVPRFQEILNATKDPKTINCKVFFKKGNTTIQELRRTVGHSFVELNLGILSCDMKICVNKKYESWYGLFDCLYDSRYKKYTDCVSIRLNLDMLYEYDLSIEDIVRAIETSYEDIACVFSPLQYGQLDVFIDTSEISLPEDRLLFINTENSKEIYLEECVQPMLEKLVVCGIHGITSVYYCKEGEEWVVETDGSNFRKLLAHPCVDMMRTTSNNVWEIYETLGIEAAREFLIEELVGIMEGINICHIKLLVERMTFSGTISSISRYTMRNEESGPLCRASFEESLENFLKAACRGEIEPTNGVSASIICGKRASVGTGMVNLKVDIENLPNVKNTTLCSKIENTQNQPKEKLKEQNIEIDNEDEPLVFHDSDDESI